MAPGRTLARWSAALRPRWSAALRLSALGAVGALALVMVAPAGPAAADPSAAELEAQIDAQWNELEPIIENYNKVHSQLKANRDKQAQLEKTLKPLQLQIDLSLSRVSDIAVQAYKSGSPTRFTYLITSGNPTGLLDQLAMLDQLSKRQLDEISAVTATRDKYLADKRALDDLVNQQTAQDADLAAKKKDIEAKISSLQKLRQQAYGAGSSGSLKLGACPYDYIGGSAGTAVSRACGKIGSAYVYGSSGPSTFDCSGLTQFAWAGMVSLPHNAADQYAKITHIGKADLRPGDLVFYYSPIHHVGIYVGGGFMVHAPSSGDYVRMAKIDRSGVATYYGRPG